MKKNILILFIFVSKIIYAQWTTTNGPYGGNVWSMVADKGIIYTATANGAYRSFNNGETWSDISIPKSTTVLSLARNDSFIFASTNEGIFRTKNQGKNWEQIKTPTRSSPNMVYTNDEDIYSFISDTLFKSSNNGKTWLSTGLSKYVSSMSFKDSLIFATTFQGLFKSDDKGSTWKLVINISNTMFVLAKDSFIICATNGGVYRSINNGDQWSYTDYNIGVIGQLRGIYNYKNKILLASNKGPISSSDNGKTWTILSNGLNSPYPYTQAYAHTDSFLFTGTNTGIYKFDTAIAYWNNKTNNLNSNEVSVLYASDSIIYINGITGFWVSNNMGKQWKKLHSYPGIGPILKWGDSLFAGAGDKFIFSTNGGQTWINKPTSIISSGILNMYSDKGTIYISTMNGIYYSTNYGNQWTQITNGLPKAIITTFNINNKFFVVGTDEGMYISFDKGQIWNKTSDSFNTSNNRIFDIAIKDTILYVNAYNRLYLSLDYGASWQKISQNIDSVNFSEFIISGKYLIAGTIGDGVYITDNNGGNWKQINEGLPENLLVNNLKQTGEYLYAGTNGKGTWIRSLDEFMTSTKSILTNNILNIYPNPSKGQLTIASETSLLGTEYNIYDLLGKSILTGKIISDKTLIDLNSLPNGIYLLEIGGIMKEKIILSR